MEEAMNLETIITKLKSPLPVCRVCLDISMQYIEFEASLCVVNGQEITYSEGFYQLTPDVKGLPQRKMPTNFCRTCAEDLLKAFLFMKRVQNANWLLNKVNILTEGKFINDDVDDAGDDDNEPEMVYVSEPELDCYNKENIKEEPFHDQSGVDAEKADLNIMSVHQDESIKMEENNKELESDYDPLCIYKLTMEKDEEQEQLQQSEPEEETITRESDDEMEHGESITCVCSDCGLQCETESALEQHRHNSHHEDALTRCLHCDKQFPNNEIEEHLLFHEQPNLDKYEQSCENESQLIGHVNNDEAEIKKHFNCTICLATFHTKKNLALHKWNTHSGSEPETKTNQKQAEYLKCQYCPRILSKFNMKKHLQNHSANNKYLCTLCKETFPTKLDLKQHSHSHTQNNHHHHQRYACHICGKVCLRPYTLKKHIQNIHLSERKKYQCEDCGLCFSYPSYLKDHRRKHNTSSRFKCSHCDRTFLRKPQLSIHMRYHTNEFPYKCDKCDKCYVTKSNLTDHIKSRHTKVTYDCDKCKQKFKSQTGLKKHKYSHDGYPYNCPLCSAGAASRSGMKQHMMRVHKDAITEEEFDAFFPIIVPKSGYRRPKDV